jgi:hypothetical protein
MPLMDNGTTQMVQLDPKMMLSSLKKISKMLERSQKVSIEPKLTLTTEPYHKEDQLINLKELPIQTDLTLIHSLANGLILMALES